MYVVCGYLAKLTWIKTIWVGHFAGWPLLTVKNVNKHLQTRRQWAILINQDQVYTLQKRQSNPLPKATEDDLTLLLEKKNQNVYFKIIDMWEPKYKIYSD